MTQITKAYEVEIGDFLRFDVTDEKGKVHYIGKVTKIEKDTNYLEISTFIGSMGFYIKESNKWSLTKTDEKPVGWDKFEKDPDAYRSKQSDKREEKRQEEQKIKLTTKEQVFALVKSNPKLSSDKLLKLARQQVGGDDKLLSMFIKVALMHSKRGK